MSMRVHNADHFEELRQTALREASSPRSGSPPSFGGRQSFGSPLGSVSPTGSTSKSYASELLRETQQKRVAMKHELYMRDQDALQKKLTESIAENLQKQRTKREAQYMKLWKEVEDGKVLAEELREKLDMQEQSKQRQVQRMHAEWSTEVYHKLNDPVVDKISFIDSSKLNAQKHEAYQKFLDITNKKGGLFRDIIIESEYNPLSDNKCFTYHTAVDDPVKRVMRRRDEEDAIARAGSTRRGSDDGIRAVALCRDDNLDTKLWSQGVFESTPYGYFHKLMSTEPVSAESAKTPASRVQLDHYNVEYGAEAVRRELPKGKRTSFDTSITIPKTTIELR